MSERKRLMEDQAEAFIALPGGIGTYEEFFETLTLKQLGQHGKPMALLNTSGYFDPLDAPAGPNRRKGLHARGCTFPVRTVRDPGGGHGHCDPDAESRRAGSVSPITAMINLFASSSFSSENAVFSFRAIELGLIFC